MAWNAETNIKGPPGLTGPPGPKGDTGDQGPPGELSEAPIDGQQYARKNAAWTTFTSGGGSAVTVTFTPAGNLAATNVQAALVELDNEKVAKAGDTMTGPLVMPTTTLATATTVNFGAAGTGLYGNTGAIFLAISGVLRFNIGASQFQTTVPMSVPAGAANATSISFGTNVTGIYGSTTTISAAVAGNNKSTLTATALTMTVPVVLPADPSTALQAATKQYVDGKSVAVAATPPAGAQDSSLWWESDSGQLYLRYNDGNSTQWVSAVPTIDETALKAYADLTAKTYSGKNYIINGAMMVSQENGATAGTTNAYYPVDTFKYGVTGTTGVASTQQVASRTPGGSPNRCRITVTTADAAVAAGDLVEFETNLEGLRVADLKFGSSAAKTITLQFGIKAPAGTYCISFLNNPISHVYVAEYVIAAGEANTDVVKTVTIPGSQIGTWAIDNTIGLTVRWALMAGTTWQQPAGSWTAGSNAFSSANQFNFMSTNGNVFELFDVSLTEGTVAPPFKVPDYASELATCKRYWEKINVYFCGYSTSGTANAAAAAEFMAEKRATPTALLTANAVFNCTFSANTPSVLAMRTAVSVTTTGIYIIDATFSINARL